MRESFIFYRSFWDALQGRSAEERLELVECICAYVLDGEDRSPELTEFAAVAWVLIRPQLDANIKRYNDGLKGKKYGPLGGEFGHLGGRPKGSKNKPKIDPMKPKRNSHNTELNRGSNPQKPITPKTAITHNLNSIKSNTSEPKNPPNVNVNVNKTNTNNCLTVQSDDLNISPKGFDIFWQKYPRKQQKKNALKSYSRALKTTNGNADVINQGLEAYLKHKPTYQDWALPTSWLNAERWEDEYLQIEYSLQELKQMSLTELKSAGYAPAANGGYYNIKQAQERKAAAAKREAEYAATRHNSAKQGEGDDRSENS